MADKGPHSASTNVEHSSGATKLRPLRSDVMQENCVAGTVPDSIECVKMRDSVCLGACPPSINSERCLLNAGARALRQHTLGEVR
jgi:hypothetical protein